MSCSSISHVDNSEGTNRKSNICFQLHVVYENVESALLSAAVIISQTAGNSKTIIVHAPRFGI